MHAVLTENGCSTYGSDSSCTGSNADGTDGTDTEQEADAEDDKDATDTTAATVSTESTEATNGSGAAVTAFATGWWSFVLGGLLLPVGCYF